MKKLLLPLALIAMIVSSCGQMAKSVDWSEETEKQYKEGMMKEMAKKLPQDQAAFMTDCMVEKIKASGMKPLESALDANKPKIEKIAVECAGEWTKKDNTATTTSSAK